MPKKRNSVALNPLLGKGGAHQKTRKALRRQDKQALKRQLRKEWRQGGDHIGLAV